MDLPLPEGPTSATVAPASTVSEKLLNTCGMGGACCTLQGRIHHRAFSISNCRSHSNFKINSGTEIHACRIMVSGMYPNS